MNLSSKVTKLNNANENTKGRYVLYWMQMFKRASHNYALNFAIQMANERRLPLRHAPIHDIPEHGEKVSGEGIH